MMYDFFPLQVAIVFAADLMLGDPRWRLHPVRLIGMLCSGAERFCRHFAPRIPLRLCGVFAWLLVTSGTVSAAFSLIHLTRLLWYPAGWVMAAVLLYFSIAAGDLIAHGRRVEVQLRCGTIDAARQAVAMMVGRETAMLQHTDVARACIESLSENLVDGVTAPIFWAMIGAMAAGMAGGDPLVWATLAALAYKAVNTMDSMWGYRNDRYLAFGWCAARADDYANYLPARLSAFCLIGSAFLMGNDARGAARVYLRDRAKSPSPNSAHSEAAVAGALGVQLGGAARYFGVVHQKPVLGSGLRLPYTDDIVRCLRLIRTSAVLFLTITASVYWAVVNGASI